MDTPPLKLAALDIDGCILHAVGTTVTRRTIGGNRRAGNGAGKGQHVAIVSSAELIADDSADQSARDGRRRGLQGSAAVQRLVHRFRPAFAPGTHNRDMPDDRFDIDDTPVDVIDMSTASRRSFGTHDQT